MAATTSDPALAPYFLVKVDDVDLGEFVSCDGLGCEMVLEQREEGGNALFVHQLPSRLKYSNIKLTRPVAPDNKSIAAWFTKLASSGVTPGTGTIEAHDSEGSKVASWGLLRVIPVKWTGPQLNAETNKMATETLELAHEGFTDTGR